MQQKRNLIKIAVEAAGGRNRVAEAFHLSPWAISGWQRANRIPAENIRKLCEMGGVITSDQMLAFIEASATERAEA